MYGSQGFSETSWIEDVHITQWLPFHRIWETHRIENHDHIQAEPLKLESRKLGQIDHQFTHRVPEAIKSTESSDITADNGSNSLNSYMTGDL